MLSAPKLAEVGLHVLEVVGSQRTDPLDHMMLSRPGRHPLTKYDQSPLKTKQIEVRFVPAVAQLAAVLVQINLSMIPEKSAKTDSVIGALSTRIQLCCSSTAVCTPSSSRQRRRATSGPTSTAPVPTASHCERPRSTPLLASLGQVRDPPCKAGQRVAATRENRSSSGPGTETPVVVPQFLTH